MTQRARRRSRSMIAAVFLLLVACAGSGLWLTWQKQRAERWVRHTYQVSDRLSRVRILSLRAEVQRRGYLLTADPQAHALVEQIRGELPREIDALRTMSADNPDQSFRVALLASLIEERLGDYERSMWLASAGRNAEAAALLTNGSYGRNTSRLLKVATSIGDEEKRLLNVRMRNSNALEQPIKVAMFGGLMLVLLLGLLISRDRRERMASLRQANDLLAEDIARREVAEAQLALLATNATDAVFRIDLDGTITYASPSSEQVLGAPPELAVGRSMAALVLDSDKHELFQFYRLLAKGEIERGVSTCRINRPGCAGVDVWIEANCGLVRDDVTGAPVEVIASLRDVTERKRLELELGAARARAEAAASAKSSFLANMSHEIRTPMNGVLGFADLLLQGDLTEQQERHAQLIVDSGKAMMRLLNDILDISKIEAGQMQIAPERVDLRHALKGCVKLIGPAAAQKGLKVAFDVEPELPDFVQIDGLRLRQIVLNLLGNAIKFTERGSVSIAARRGWRHEKAHIEISISDTGIGIAEDRQTAIFEQFVQAEQSTARRFGGTGLGLAISSQLARLMGGTLDLISEEGQGTCFTLSVPLRLADAPQAIDAAPETAETETRSLRILLAEDHDINQALVEEMLAQLGHDYITVPDGQRAVDAVVASSRWGTKFDLVLMDMQMPVMDGVEATRAIRDAGIAAADLPILALTANAYADDIAACLTAGMQAHIAKPVQVAELGATIRRWTRRDAAQAAPDPAAVAEPGTATALTISPQLRERYETRKAELCAYAERLAAAYTFDDPAIEELCSLLHKLAGSAGMFREAELGAKAADLEDALEACPPAQRPAVVREVVQVLKAA